MNKESDMNKILRSSSLAVSLAVAMLWLGAPAAFAQASGPGYASRTYECQANAHCSITCTVDGEKEVQTGGAKTVTVTPIAPNNYLIELAEQNGHVQFAYLGGAKVVCTLEGVTKTNGQ